MRCGLSALLLLLTPAWVGGQPLVVSPAPEAISVTVYRGGGGELDLEWLEGYAFITETRTIDLPAGPSEIRFEGVAGGIIPVSALISGLPGAAAEKNRDARLLSPGGLIDARLGRRVHIRRTDRATGRVTETEAILRSGPTGVVLETRDGIEALRCTGLPETFVYDQVPDGLTAKPTLAVRTESAAPARATVRLSYLSTGFDWRANYVISMAPDGRTLDLFAWLTLANQNDESFPAAQTQAIAGQVNKDEEDELGESDVPAEIRLECWPAGTTSDVDLTPPPAEGELRQYAVLGSGDIVVTGTLVRNPNLSASNPVSVVAQARQEELGDLKLYRLPEPVTVAAKSQKQVALLIRSGVRFERVYGKTLNARSDDEEATPVDILLRFKNEKKQGLGVPLPAGTAAVFEDVEGRRMLAGKVDVEDTPIGQEFDLEVAQAPQVTIKQRRVETKERKERRRDGRAEIEKFEVELANANLYPVVVETLLEVYGNYQLDAPSRKLGVRNGRDMWRTKVPANGRSKLSYTVKPLTVTDEADAEE